MKNAVILSAIAVLFACEQQQISTIEANITESAVDNKIKQEVVQAVTQAKSAGDYRLLATSNRLPQFPGTDPERYQELMAKCGARYMEGTGDVKRKKEQPGKRQKLKVYMVQYNQLMLPVCLAK